MGVVYRAVDAKTERAVALKLLLGADEKSLARFRREARAAASLRHPNIVGVLDFDIDDPNGAYIVMELVDGASLHLVLESEGRLPEARAVAIATQLLSALAHAHGEGILHRDVKPGNVLITKTHAAPDFVRLVDFGLAKHTEPSDSDPAITTMASMVGTPAFMAPEQMLGDALDARVDIYGSGLVLYRMLAGTDPYVAHGTERVLAVITREPGRPLLSVAPWVSPRLAALVDECVSPDRAQRPASAAEVIERLSRLGTPVESERGAPTLDRPGSDPMGAATVRPDTQNGAPTVGGPEPLPVDVNLDTYGDEDEERTKHQLDEHLVRRAAEQGAEPASPHTQLSPIAAPRLPEADTRDIMALDDEEQTVHDAMAGLASEPASRGSVVPVIAADPGIDDEETRTALAPSHAAFAASILDADELAASIDAQAASGGTLRMYYDAKTGKATAHPESERRVAVAGPATQPLGNQPAGGAGPRGHGAVPSDAALREVATAHPFPPAGPRSPPARRVARAVVLVVVACVALAALVYASVGLAPQIIGPRLAPSRDGVVPPRK
jgi:hypothetical protein